MLFTKNIQCSFQTLKNHQIRQQLLHKNTIKKIETLFKAPNKHAKLQNTINKKYIILRCYLPQYYWPKIQKLYPIFSVYRQLRRNFKIFRTVGKKLLLQQWLACSIKPLNYLLTPYLVNSDNKLNPVKSLKFSHSPQPTICWCTTFVLSYHENDYHSWFVCPNWSWCFHMM